MHRRGEREQPFRHRAARGRLLGQLAPPEPRRRVEAAAARVTLIAPPCCCRRREQAAEVEAAGAGAGEAVEARWEERDASTAHGAAQHVLDHKVAVARLPAVVAEHLKARDLSASRRVAPVAERGTRELR